MGCDLRWGPNEEEGANTKLKIKSSTQNLKKKRLKNNYLVRIPKIIFVHTKLTECYVKLNKRD